MQFAHNAHLCLATARILFDLSGVTRGGDTASPFDVGYEDLFVEVDDQKRLKTRPLIVEIRPCPLPLIFLGLRPDLTKTVLNSSVNVSKPGFRQ